MATRSVLPKADQSPGRVDWVDYAKALGITLVVLGHEESLPAPFIRWIFSFHMPLFFVLAGVVLKATDFELSLSAFLKKRVLRLLLAYGVFALIGLAHFALVKRFGHSTYPHSIKDQALAYLYGSGARDGTVNVYPLPLWFLPALIVGSTLCYGLRQLPWPYALLAAIFCLLLSFELSAMALPFSLETGFCAAFFLYLGSLIGMRANPLPRLWSLLLGIAALSLGALLMSLSPKVDFRILVFWNPLYTLSAFACSFLGLFLLLSQVSGRRIIRRMADASLFIFPIHLLLFYTYNFIAARLNHWRIPDSLESGLLKCSLSLFLCVLLGPPFLALLGLAKRPSAHPKNAAA